MVPNLFEVISTSVLLALLAGGVLSQQDFLSIDCGMLDEQSYIDPDTNLTYISDANLIDVGLNYTIRNTQYTSNKPMQTSTLRSFPNVSQNCYQIGSINMGNLAFKIDLNYKYIIRAFFLYGNYDGKKTASGDFQFKLYLGVNLWTIINIENSGSLYIAEIITLASADNFMVCLVNTGHGVPFISALELRRINDRTLYQDVNNSVSLVYHERYNLGSPANKTIRYPIDEWDRIWLYCSDDDSSYDGPYICPTRLNTLQNVQQDDNDHYKVPLSVMQSAWYDKYTLRYHFDARNIGINRPTYYIYLHFAELQDPQKYGYRFFDLILPSDQSTPTVLQTNINPSYLKVTHLPFPFDIPASTTTYFDLNMTSNSSLPPMLNAAEIFIRTTLSGDATDPNDVVCMMTIKNTYKMSKWQGDPCRGQSPWDNVNCPDVAGTPSKIKSLNFSSLGLMGSISSGFENLNSLETLDLSINELTGPVPEFLGKLSSLRSLNLSRNNFTGTIPSILLQRQSNGSLQFSWDNNPFLSVSDTSSIARKRKYVILLVSSAIITGTIIMLIILFIWRKRKRNRRQPGGGILDDKLIHSQCRRFAYEELKAATYNFKDKIGHGGFGDVYHGMLEDGTEVAVKLRSFISNQGAKEFQNEALLLSRVHHRNMVRLVGYCDDNNSLALVYEFMANGSLKDFLISGNSGRRIITWRQRLQIALESAQGLEYLHRACIPPIIHRDIKSSNILLSDKLSAKIADFGLSRAFLNDDHTHFSATYIAGTPGYIDPEYSRTSRVTEKSDVYAFGIVLLELVTGLPAIVQELETQTGSYNLADWINLHHENDTMDRILDSSVLNDSDPISVHNFVSLAIMCTNPVSNHRPIMTEVVLQLKEIIGAGNNNSGNISDDESDTVQINWSLDSYSGISK